MTAEDNTVSRRELEARLDSLTQAILSQKESVAIAMIAADRAVTKAETAVEKRFENSNEWRNTVETLQRTYLPRTEFDQATKTLTDKISVNTELMKAREARAEGAGQSWAVIGLIISALANAVGILLYFTKAH
jgi:hypothetical protein